MNDETLFTGAIVAAGPQQTPQHDWAVLVHDGKIMATAPAADLRRDHPNAELVDAGNTTILPGLTDAHGHLYGLGLAIDIVDLVGTTTYDEAIARVKARVATLAPGDWARGRGWDQNRWPDKQFPTAAPLDAAIPDHPVWLKRVDGHAGVANTAALRAAGITRDTKDPEGGRIIRDASGNPTGVFVDAAQALIESKIPEPSFALRKQRVLAAANRIAENGLTEMHDAGADGDTIRAVKELVDEGKFPIRMYTMLTDDDALLGAWLAKGPMIDHGGRFTVRSIKLYADGALGSRGALLLAPYSDDPTNTGLEVTKPAHMVDVATRARERGFQVCTHAIGDRGVRNVIESYEAAGVKPENRFRIEHFQVVAPEDFARTVRDGIIASMQPTHATSDMPWAETRIGPERIKGAYAWRTVLNDGGRLALGSDFPVESVNPFFGIYSAVTRQDQQGNPPGGWYPEQKLTLAEAIRGFTLDAAYAAFEEQSRGTIEPGKLADFTIVEGDFYTTPQNDLFKTKVRYTVVGGNVVYSGQSSAHVDHILLGAPDLDAGVRELESLTGIHAKYGGEHPHLGTHNAIVSLGSDTYIEVIAPRPGATLNDDMKDLAKLERLTPIGWAVAMPDITALRTRLGGSGLTTTEPRPGSRQTPWGDTLHWQTVNFDSPRDNTPFFIHWEDAAKHPSHNAPGGCTLGAIEFDDPNMTELTRVQRALGFEFPVRQAEKAAMRVTLRCGEKVVKLPQG